MIFVIIACLASAAMIVAFVETRILRIKTYFINAPEKADIEKVRIALVSDLHCTCFGKGNRRLIEKIASTGPDLLIVAGDVINGRESETEYAVNFFDAVKHAGINAIYIFGNHEQKLTRTCIQAYDAYVSELSDHVRIVNNKTVEINGIVIKGLLIPLPMYRDKISNIQEYFNATELVGKFEDDGKYHILVAHDPTFTDYYDEIGADLTLSGHLHGGLIRIPGIGGLITPRHRIFPRRTRGLFDSGKGKLLVTSGVGWHAVPFRFCNDPQICLIEIGKGEQKDESEL